MPFTATAEGEVVATFTVQCDQCDWGKAESEGAVLTVGLDARPRVHLPVFRTGEAQYRVLLGPVEPGDHTLWYQHDGAVDRVVVEFEQIPVTAQEYRAVSLAPFVYARPDTVGKFTDVPLLMWYELEPTDRGTRYRYSVIFSNEDGGTPADRLMATWGRTTDIEYIYSVEVDGSGTILSEDMQGPEHKILPFKGQREGRHPLLWVSTENNMVLDSGTTTVRYAPAPALVNLDNASREVVMDANPWTYEVMAKELLREGKIVADAPPGRGAIPDPRRFVFLEACGEAGSNAITASVNVAGAWHSSDRGVAEYRIVRDGCFRVAIPLPGATSARDVTAIRFHAHARTDRPSSISRITRVNRVFSLGDLYDPAESVFQWQGDASLKAGGSPLEIGIR